MLNLLPSEHKKKVVGEYKKRVWTTICLGLIIVVLVSALFLGPVYIMTRSVYSTANKTKADLEARITASQKGTAVVNIGELAGTVAALQKFSVLAPPSNLIEAVVAAKPRGVRYTHITYIPSQSDPATIDLSGKADTRADMVALAENLKKDRHFSSVNVPISIFAKEKNIEFSVKLVASSAAQI